MLTNRSRLAWLTAYVLAAVVAIAGVAYYVAHRNDDESTPPATAALPERMDVDFPITLSVVGGARRLPQGGLLSLGAEAGPRGVRTIELWDGARKVATSTATGGHAAFRWAAVQVGQHLLYARASDGTTSASSAVHAVDVYAAPSRVDGRVPPVALPVERGEDAGAVAGRLGVPTTSVRVAGTTATVQLPTATASPLDGQDVTVDESEPAADGPVAEVVPDGCTVKIRATGATGALRVAHATAGRPGFVLAGSTSGDGTMTLDHLTPGTHVVALEQGTKRSAPVSFVAPQRCVGDLGWTGSVSLSDGVLTVPTPVTHGYAYVSVDDQPAVRVPADPTAFLASPTRRVDVTGMLPTMDGSTVTVEAWQQNGATAARIGSGKLVPPKDLSLTDVLGEPGELTLQGRVGTTTSDTLLTLPKDGEVTFTWSGTTPRITAVRYQVLGVPLTPGNHDIDPIGTLDAGMSGSSDQVVHLADNGLSGQFVLNTFDLERSPSAGTDGSSPLPDYLADLLGAYTGTLYVRAVGLEKLPSGDFAPVGVSSDAVQLNVPAKAGVKPQKFEITDFQVIPGSAPNYELQRCVRVTGTHWNSVPPGFPVVADVLQAFYPQDGRYCYDDFDHDTSCGLGCWLSKAFDAVVDGLSFVWDLIATAYNGIIDLAAGLIAKFNPLCLALQAADTGGDSCEAIGKLVARSVISAVLSAYGLPPSLPTSSQLKAVASGNLTELGVLLLSELGVPCDDLKLDSTDSAAVSAVGKELGVGVPTAADGSIDACRIAVEAVLKTVKKQIQDQFQADTAAAAGLPPCPPELCTMVPDPGAHTSPTVVLVKAKRVAGKPTTNFVMPLKITLSGLGNFAQSPFRGGYADLRPNLFDPDRADGVFTFAIPTPGFNVDGVDESDGIHATVTDPAKGTAGEKVVNSRSADVHFGPSAKK